MQQQLTEDQPQWTQHSSVKGLGVTITTKNRLNSEVEAQRIQKSIARTKLLASLPLPRPKILDMYQALVVPVAAYGWTCRKAPAETAKVLHNTLTKALNTTKMANTEIRKVVYAATTHLDIITLQRLFRCSCRLRWHRKVQWNNRAFTSIHLLRKHMKDHGWRETGPWNWTDPHSRATIKLEATTDSQSLKFFCHQLRTRWRQRCLSNWAKGPRHALWRETATSWTGYAQQRTPPLQLRGLCSWAQWSLPHGYIVAWEHRPTARGRQLHLGNLGTHLLALSILFSATSHTTCIPPTALWMGAQKSKSRSSIAGATSHGLGGRIPLECSA